MKVLYDFFLGFFRHKKFPWRHQYVCQGTVEPDYKCFVIKEVPAYSVHLFTSKLFRKHGLNLTTHRDKYKENLL